MFTEFFLTAVLIQFLSTSLQAFEKYCRSAHGYLGLVDVYQTKPVKRGAQESYFLAETLKYLYLIFSDDSLLPLDRWVFNTEGHPLPITKTTFAAYTARPLSVTAHAASSLASKKTGAAAIHPLYSKTAPTASAAQRLSTKKIIPVASMARRLSTKKIIPAVSMAQRLSTKKIIPAVSAARRLSTKKIIPAASMAQRLSTKKIIPAASLARPLSIKETPSAASAAAAAAGKSPLP